VVRQPAEDQASADDTVVAPPAHKRPMIRPLEIPADIDLEDPQQRFRLNSVAVVDQKARAIVTDLKSHHRYNVTAGDTMGDFIVREVNYANRTLTITAPRSNKPIKIEVHTVAR
jgi:hypothetical protein